MYEISDPAFVLSLKKFLKYSRYLKTIWFFLFTITQYVFIPHIPVTYVHTRTRSCQLFS